MKTLAPAAVLLALLLAGCTAKGSGGRKPEAEAPPPAVVEHESDAGVVKVGHPERFPLVTATERNVAPELNVTGVVSPDVSKNAPVTSLASARRVERHA